MSAREAFPPKRGPTSGETPESQKRSARTCEDRRKESPAGFECVQCPVKGRVLRRPGRVLWRNGVGQESAFRGFLIAGRDGNTHPPPPRPRGLGRIPSTCPSPPPGIDRPPRDQGRPPACRSAPPGIDALPRARAARSRRAGEWGFLFFGGWGPPGRFGGARAGRRAKRGGTFFVFGGNIEHFFGPPLTKTSPQQHRPWGPSHHDK